ncbi:ABC transporter ATP-binding protein [Granulosicoccus antarcticus]|uniref:Lipoprotein-releasing system ATP-binding protein LolD n=1 Tax=Granulosicoccus antarcticus IMCC3135 TaxID=1192854 RepID=A0A2Z2NHK9_9GAMM|nr:ABC transporter ATP-binding protein [Granulosicoccus antarcticus]ASJ70772.1 Lipoprotein-releasing system ATP-binding protein LolD [Granulosicoccus antarcticus IMCC3135]
MISLQNIAMQYRMAGESIDVLKALNLDIDARERVAIVGPSGSGKTTLLLLLTGLEQPTSGEIMIAGRSLATLDRDARADLRRDTIGIVFQSFHLISSLTAEENVALPLDIAGQPNSDKRAREMLARVGLSERGGHYPAQLSGGEQQRVAIARALVHEPALLVADEPTGNLDERTGESIIELLFSLNRESGTTLLLVTHDPQLAARCDRSLRLENGQLHAVVAP